MSKTPAQNSVELVENQPFIDIRSARFEEVTIDSVARDDNNTPTTQLRKGLVLGESGSDAGKFVDAADATVQANAAAYIDSAEAPDGDWEGETITIEVEGEGVLASYTLGTNTTVSNLATLIQDLEAEPGVNALVRIANNGSGAARFTALDQTARLIITCSLATAFDAAANAANTASPTVTKYVVLAETIRSILGIDDSAEDRNASVVSANAILSEDDLLSLTQDARDYFRKVNLQLA